MTRLAPGTLIGGRYHLDRLLGEGGMGSVWAATHTVTERSFALKFLSASMVVREGARRRFLREARAACAVDHPNVVRVHDVFETEAGLPVMVMDLLEGETLGARLERDKPLGLEEVARLLLPVVSAVGAAHAAGIVHRDLKPENVFLSEEHEGTVIKVLDFGVAKLVDETGGTLSGTGSPVGTPHYMAPEQAFGEADVDHRVDIWALGVMLYESLSGQRPLSGDTIRQVLRELISEAPVTPITEVVPDLPEHLAELVMRMLERDRALRPGDLREVKDALAPYTDVKVRDFDAPGSSRTETASRPNDTSVESAIDPEGKTWDASTTFRSNPDVTAGAHSISVNGDGARKRTALIALAATVVIVGAGWSLVADPETSTESTSPDPSAATAIAASGEPVGPPGPRSPARPTSRAAAASPASAASALATPPAPDSGADRSPAETVETPRRLKKTVKRSRSGSAKRKAEPEAPKKEGLVETVPF